jgi:hypothetical protein
MTSNLDIERLLALMSINPVFRRVLGIFLFIDLFSLLRKVFSP